MKRWNINKVLFYSHDGRREAVEFDLGKVNIITGENYTGKSALVEVIDYCLFSSVCHIPGVVREASSWVGIVFEKEVTSLLILRRVPPISDNKGSEDIQIEFGKTVAIPERAADIISITKRGKAVKQFEQFLGLGDVQSETFNPQRPSRRVSFRSALPYMLQSDDVIISKITVLRGANDDHRQSIIDSLPYFMGVSDERTIAKQSELRRLERQFAQLSQEATIVSASAEARHSMAVALLLEASQVGIVDPPEPEIAPERAIGFLRAIATWNPSTDATLPDDATGGLQREERRLLNELAAVQQQIAATQDIVESASTYVQNLTEQRRKVDVTQFFEQARSLHNCPVCNRAFDEASPLIEDVQKAFDTLSSELTDVEKQRPQLDLVLSDLRGRSEDLKSELRTVRRRITAAVRTSELIQANLDLDQARNRVCGRASLFIEQLPKDGTDGSVKSTDNLRSRIKRLTADLNDDAKKAALQNAQRELSAIATELLHDLPFDPEYPNGALEFDCRTLTAYYSHKGAVREIRDLGGDESYLSSHVAIMLAFQRFFLLNERPVPGVIVFDQLSRPFFPADRFPGEVVVRSDEQGKDRSDLKRYFDVLFDHVADQKETLQIIVLEHAYFADDERFRKATKYRWTKLNKLIPNDWPRNPEPESGGAQ
jgi:hypothetical protein